MKRILVCLGLLLIASAAGAQQSSGLFDRASDMASGSLAGMLESQLGVTEDQAEGGIGSMLGLAQEKLASGDFDRLAGAIPNADSYLAKARELGALAEPLTSMADLNGALGKLGLSPETIQKFVPMVTDMVGKVGGDEVKQLLATALGS